MPGLNTLFTALLLSVAPVVAKNGVQRPATFPALDQLTPQGCFASLPADSSRITVETAKIATGHCGWLCKKEKRAVAVVAAAGCYCADTYPYEDDLVDDTQCNHPCPAYPLEACGGKNPAAYGVYNTGLKLLVDYDVGKSTSSVAFRPSATVTSNSHRDTMESSASASASDVPNNAAGKFSTLLGKIAKKVKEVFKGNGGSASDQVQVKLYL